MDINIANQPEDSLCDRCGSLNISQYKFKTQETATASSATITGDFDGVGFGHTDLGFLDEIYGNRVICSFCRLIYNASHSSTGFGIGHDGLNAKGRRIRCSMEWHHDCRGNDSMPTTRRLRVFSDDTALTEFYIVPILPSSTEEVSLLAKSKDDEAVDYQLLSEWYQVCSVDHKSCQEHQKKDLLPFKHPIRLIDVNSMRLVVVDMEVTPTTYAALSYVWGQSQNLVLVLANLQELLNGIPKERLPKTVQDAITVVRELKIDYIWIDALCIIQDCMEDWTEQLASMSQVYHQATLCICAAYGSNSSTGIPGVSSTPGRLRQNVEVYKEIPLTTLRPVAAIVSASPWDSRAWTFQERLLSTRCAIFTADGMIWQCPTTTWREDMESSLTRPAWTLDSVASPLQALQGNPLRSYINCVNIYSGRLLTKSSDKLVAFIGLSQVLSRGLLSKLEHGMPLRYLDWALLWEPESAGKRIISHDLVSWSWCGWERKVNWRFSTIEGTLFNLHNWLTEHTWIVWYLGDGEKWNLAWNDRHFVEQESPLQRWDGYSAGPHDRYGRSRDAIRCRDKRRFSIDGTFDEDGEEELERFKSQHRPDKGLLLFQTFTSWFALSRKSHSKQTDMGKDLHRFGLTDKLGDWCGTVILDKEWFNNVGGLFEFAAISDAKEFSFEELDTWNYYIPEERQQAEWYCFYALMLSWREGHNGRAAAERVGLAKIYQSSFFSRSFRPCSWKSIILS